MESPPEKMSRRERKRYNAALRAQKAREKAEKAARREAERLLDAPERRERRKHAKSYRRVKDHMRRLRKTSERSTQLEAMWPIGVLLAAAYPGAFVSPPKPLAKGVVPAVLKAIKDPEQRAAVERYCAYYIRSEDYLTAQSEPGAITVRLDGSEGPPVSEEQAQHARTVLLGRMRAQIVEMHRREAATEQRFRRRREQLAAIEAELALQQKKRA